MKALLCILFAACLCAGCTTVTAHKEPGADLSKYHRIFVEQPFNENHHIDEMIVDELRRLGIDARSGPLTMMSEKTEAVIKYNARWTGDFSTYLIDMNLTVHALHPQKPVAEARFYQPSAFTKPPERVVHELVKRLFGSS